MDYNAQIHWNFSGAFAKHDLLVRHLLQNSLIRKYKQITVYDGIENCVWNAGRMHRYVPYDQKIRDRYYALGWTINLCFTNTKIDLNDEKGNWLLETFHREGNAIILVNDDLRKYIRTNFPKYKLICSITTMGSIKHPLRDEDVDFYKQKQDLYDVIVPRCDSNLDPRLEELDKSRVEILLNDTCILNCPHFSAHFGKIAEWNQGGQETPDGEWQKTQECWIEREKFWKQVGEEKACMGEKYPFNLEFNQIKHLIERGFSNFKLQGREETTNQYLADLSRFVVDYNRSS